MQSQVLDLAKKLEGSVPIIPVFMQQELSSLLNPLIKIIPVCTSKETELVTQFDGSLVESAGMLKMDFSRPSDLVDYQWSIDFNKKNRPVRI